MCKFDGRRKSLSEQLCVTVHTTEITTDAKLLQWKTKKILELYELHSSAVASIWLNTFSERSVATEQKQVLSSWYLQ